MADLDETDLKLGRALKRYADVLAKGEPRKGRRPLRPPPREQIILHHNVLIEAGSNQPELVNYQFSFWPSPYPPCTTPFNELKKLTIRRLLQETHHEDVYMLLRSITPPARNVCITTIVEDEKGNAVRLVLYNQTDEEERPAKEILGEGTIMIVKQPFLKLMPDGLTAIRVDHLSDVVPLEENDELIPLAWRSSEFVGEKTANDWREQGNDEFRAGKHYVAIASYTRAIECSPSQEEVFLIKLNRSLAYMTTEQYDAALADCEHASSIKEPNEKLIRRKANALYKLDRYREACNALLPLCQKSGGYPEAEKDFARAMKRFTEKMKGAYNWRDLHNEMIAGGSPEIDHATYIGPVEVREADNRGQGLFTTKPIRAGDLILCEKAFVFNNIATPGSEREKKLNTMDIISVETGIVLKGTFYELLHTIIHKLRKNPSQLSTFTKLYRNGYISDDVFEVDGKVVIDSFLVECILNFNWLSGPKSTREEHVNNLLTSKSADLDDEELKKGHSSFGIWLMASYMNHCCMSNARRSFIGNMMMVRATQDIPADTEVTVRYKGPMRVGANCPAFYQDLGDLGFQCDCAMCESQRTIGRDVLNKRVRALSELCVKIPADKKNTDNTEVEALMAELISTYSLPPEECPRIDLWERQTFLTVRYMAQGEGGKCVNMILEGFKSLGYIIEGGTIPHTPGEAMVIKRWGFVMDRAIENWAMLETLYKEEAPDLVEQAAAFAKLTYKMCCGEDETYLDTLTDLSAVAKGVALASTERAAECTCK